MTGRLGGVLGTGSQPQRRVAALATAVVPPFYAAAWPHRGNVLVLVLALVPHRVRVVVPALVLGLGSTGVRAGAGDHAPPDRCPNRCSRGATWGIPWGVLGPMALQAPIPSRPPGHLEDQARDTSCEEARSFAHSASRSRASPSSQRPRPSVAATHVASTIKVAGDSPSRGGCGLPSGADANTTARTTSR